MARRTKEEAEETKKAICLAALDIFCEKGYSRTTFDEIAKRINLTKGAIYWHFRNKADILTEIIRKGFTISQSLLNVNISQVLKTALRKSQESGEISSSVNIEELSWLLACMHQGMIKNIISNNYQGDASHLVSTGFDLIIKGSQMKG